MGVTDSADICGAALNEAPYRVAEAPPGRKVEREVLTGLGPPLRRRLPLRTAGP
jgi:hypothetical protein